MSTTERVRNPKVVAASLTRKVLERSLFINELLNNTLDLFSLEDRRFITELSYGTMRNLSYIDFWLGLALKKPLTRIDRDLLSLLRVTLYQLLFMRNREERSVIHEAVELVKSSPRREAAGFVNFLLREVQRLRPSRIRLYRLLLQDRDAFYQTFYSIPPWLYDLIGSLVGQERRKTFLELTNRPLGVTLRVEGDSRRRSEILAHLANSGATGELSVHSPYGIYTDRAVTWSMIRGFPDVYIQDESSQLAVLDMEVSPGAHVLDLCAAPGGKTLFLSWLVGETGQVVAADINPHKLHNLAESLARTGRRNVEIKLHDATRHRPEWEARFPFVMADLPCSALGTVRRHPEIKWLKTPEDAVTMARLAGLILDNAARYVASRGVLLFSVCTFTREETTEQIQKFIMNHTNFRVEKAYYSISGPDDRRDIFFICRLRRMD